MIRVGFVLTFVDQGWLGGISYFRNLFGALRSLPERRIEPVIITRRDAKRENLSSFEPAEIIRTALVETEGLVWRVRRAMQLYIDRDYLFERLLRSSQIGLLSHSGYLGRHCPIPSLPWIPDFQELHLPEFFSSSELAARRRNVEECCARGTAVLLSSATARHDLETNHPSCTARAKVLPFVASVPQLAALPTPAELQGRYGFSGPFFHLPNQFWAHKNHRIVLEAQRILKDRGLDVLILATGNTTDHRQPGYLESLLASADALEVANRFRLLGVVPYIDLMGLMAASVAVINPSLFEGWSTTVEEAKSLGKQVILSNIPVHREQTPARALYFDPNSADELASQLRQAWVSTDRSADLEHMYAAQDRLPERRQRFARQFEEIAANVIAR